MTLKSYYSFNDIPDGAYYIVMGVLTMHQKISKTTYVWSYLKDYNFPNHCGLTYIEYGSDLTYVDHKYKTSENPYELIQMLEEALGKPPEHK